jgi:chromosome segregation ATPase
LHQKKVRRASRAPPLETESEDEIIILLRDKLKRGKIAEAALKEMEGKYAMLIRKYELLINVQQLDKKAGEALKEQVMTCTNERDTLQAENHKLRSENEQLCNDKGGAISKIEELTRKNEELNRGNEELEQKNTALTTDSHTEIEDLKGQVGRLEAERNDLFTECQESTATNKQLIDAKTGLTAQVKVLAAVNDTLAVEKENYIAEKESFDNEMKKRLSGKITLVKDKANFKKEKSDLINDKAKLIKEKNDLINEKADLTSEKNDWIAEKIALIAENDKLAEEKEKLTDQVKEEQQAAKDTLSNFEAYKMRVRDLGNS